MGGGIYDGTEPKVERRYKDSTDQAKCDQVSQPPEVYMIYELKQKREYHIRQLVNIQKAIDAISDLGF